MNRRSSPRRKPIIGDEERAAVDRVLRSGMLAQGPEVAAFEEEFAEHFGRRPRLRRRQLRHLGSAPRPAGRGRRPRRRGHRAVVHLRRDRQLGRAHRRHPGLRRHRARRTSASTRPRSRPRSPTRTAAIMPVHLYGHPARHDRAAGDRRRARPRSSSRTPRRRTAPRCDGTPGRHLRRVRDVQLLPDQEHDLRRGRHGLDRDRRRLERRMRLLRNQGMEQQYENEVVGFNTRMTDIARRHRPGAADQGRRLDRAAAGERGLPRRATSRASSSPPVADGAVHVYHQYTVRVPEDRDGFADALREEYGVGSRRLLPDPEPPAARPFQRRRRPAGDRAGRGRGAVAAGPPVADARTTSTASSTRSTPLAKAGA